MKINKKFMVCFLINLIILTAFVNLAEARTYGTQNSVHNLTASGPGDIKSSEEDNYCLYCHTPHESDPVKPLWNHTMSGEVYILYDSPTTDATDIGQPSGSSELCLSCHDGTIAMGDLNFNRSLKNAMITDNTTGKLDSSNTFSETATANLGTDLSDDHPISFTYGKELATTDGGLYDPTVKNSGLGGTIDDDMLEKSKLQCVSCHEPHDNTNGNFLIKDNSNGELCNTCHIGLGSNSAHSNCAGCHGPHGNSLSQLRTGNEEALCFNCHDGTTNASDIKSQMNKFVGHDVTAYDGIHSGDEGSPPSNNKHIECSDCHNPHKAEAGTHTKGTNQASGALAGTEGLSASYGTTSWIEPTLTLNDPINKEYELCLRCHSTASIWTFANADAERLDVYINPNNKAQHAIHSKGNIQDANMNKTFVGYDTGNPVVTINSTIYCSDCHGSETPSDPKGPHGSDDSWFLKTSSNLDKDGNDYVCYDCHRPDVYGGGGKNGNLSRWTEHTKSAHQDVKNATFPSNTPKISCLVCHGDFTDGYGGLHGADYGNQTYTKIVNDTATHFLNGFGVEWIINSDGTRSCGSYQDNVTNVGCGQHPASSGDSGGPGGGPPGSGGGGGDGTPTLPKIYTPNW